MTFEFLVSYIRQIDKHMTAQAGRAININLTLRNWLIGFHIAEYELRGADRANYGDRLLTDLARQLTNQKVSNCSRRQLYRYLRFYRLYPQIVGTLSPQLKELLPAQIGGSDEVGTAFAQFHVSPEKLLQRLSYSQIELIVDLEDDLQRAFYEKEDIRRFLEEKMREVADDL